MKLYLVRHGNTFNSGNEAYWVGSQEDLKLTESGLAQAHAVAAELNKLKLDPAAVISATLQRTQQTAQIICEALNCSSPLQTDSRLNEIDYGPWGGLNNDQIIERYGVKILNDWQDAAIWPTGIFRSNEATHISEVSSLVAELRMRYQRNDQSVVLVSSNGRLRYFQRSIAGAFQKALVERSLKMRTGTISCLNFPANAAEELIYWDLRPSSVS